MKFILCVFIICLQVFADDFITKKEYFKMLYENPRGISCAKCHGEKGEGKVISTYKHKGKEKKLYAPAINNLDKKEFFEAVENSKGIMPTYFLTKNEIESLYEYLKEQNKSKKGQK